MYVFFMYEELILPGPFFVQSSFRFTLQNFHNSIITRTNSEGIRPPAVFLDLDLDRATTSTNEQKIIFDATKVNENVL